MPNNDLKTSLGEIQFGLASMHIETAVTELKATQSVTAKRKKHVTFKDMPARNPGERQWRGAFTDARLHRPHVDAAAASKEVIIANLQHRRSPGRIAYFPTVHTIDMRNLSPSADTDVLYRRLYGLAIDHNGSDDRREQLSNERSFIESMIATAEVFEDRYVENPHQKRFWNHLGWSHHTGQIPGKIDEFEREMDWAKDRRDETKDPAKAKEWADKVKEHYRVDIKTLLLPTGKTKWAKSGDTPIPFMCDGREYTEKASDIGDMLVNAASRALCEGDMISFVDCALKTMDVSDSRPTELISLERQLYLMSDMINAITRSQRSLGQSYRYYGQSRSAKGGHYTARHVSSAFANFYALSMSPDDLIANIWSRHFADVHSAGIGLLIQRAGEIHA